MKKANLEFGVGLFLAAGALCLAWLSVKIARNEFFASNGYEVRARFSDCSGLRSGSPVVVAGVEVGRVKSIALEDYEAKVSMAIQPGLVLQKDVMASIKTKGLIGEKYIELTPGASEERIPPGGLIHSTEPALDLEGLISKYVHGTLGKSEK
jgi:phospholipid/cholesterol/gamma-HCH transport system substrate-binding protein